MLTQAHQLEQTASTVVAKITSRELSTLQAQELVSDLMQRMRYDNAQFFIIDLAGVQFIASGSLGSLVGFLQDLEHVRGKVALVGCQPDVLFLFKVTRLDAVFRLYDDVQAAVDDITRNDARR